MRSREWVRAVIILALLAMVAPAVHAQTAAVPADPYAGKLIQRPDQPAPAGNSAPASSFHDGNLDAGRVCLALGGVLILILILRAAVKRLMPGAVGQKNTGAIKVISRVTLSPRQRLLLVQIGKRLVMVGDTGTQLNPLCELADPQEIAAVLMQVHEESAGALRRFESFFGKAKRSYKEDDEIAESIAGGQDTKIADTNAGDSKAEFDSTRDLPPDTTMAQDATLQKTQRELAGLSDKVRDLVRQFSTPRSSASKKL